MNRTSLQFIGLLLFFLGIAIGIYWPGLSGGLLLDDSPQLIPIIHAVNSENWAITFKQFIVSNSGYLGRPISMLTFIINAALFGDDIWYWKLTNVILHGACGFTIFLCTYLLLSLNKLFSSRQSVLIAFSTSFIWLALPLHVSTVLYTVQRMTILSTLFTFLAFNCFLYAINRYQYHKNGTVYLISSLGFFLFSTLSKESGILYPIFILLIHFHLQYQLENYNDLIKPKITLYINIIYLILFIGIISFIFLFDRLTMAYSFRDFSLTERLLTQARVIFLYLYQIIFPLPSSMGFFHDDFIISNNLTTPFSTLVSIISLCTILFWVTIKFKQFGIFSFGLLFFFLSHLLESTVLPLEMVFEHRNYIGSWGIILSLVYLLTRYIHKPIYSILCIVIIFSAFTLYRVSIWGSPNTLFPHMMKMHPDSLRLKTIFAESYSQANQYDKALIYLENEKSLGSRLQILNIKCKKTLNLKKDELNSLLSIKNIKIGTYEMEGLINLANLGLDQECNFNKEDFITLLNKVLLRPIINNVAEQKLLLYLAHYYHELKQTEKYLDALQLSFLKDKNNPIPLFLKIDWLIELKRYKEAHSVFITAKHVAENSRLDYGDFVIHAETELTKIQKD